ncbi:UNVERIFIED_ORG: hypothetical protein J2Y78_002052 [Buttiauxella agrestis ATCC 33320]
MNPELSKQKQKSDAASRAAAAAPSQVNATSPMLYQAPQINVPGSLHEVAILVQEELTKIQQSQAVLVSIWQAVQAQHVDESGNLVIDRILITTDVTQLAKKTPTSPYVEVNSNSAGSFIDFHAPTAGNDFDVRFYAEGGANGTSGRGKITIEYGSFDLKDKGNRYSQWNVCVTSRLGTPNIDRAAWGWGSYNSGTTGSAAVGGYGTVLTIASNGDNGYADAGRYIDAYTGGGSTSAWLQQIAISTSADIGLRCYTNTGVWGAWRLLSSTARVNEVDHKHRHRIWQLEKRVTELESRLTAALKDESTK